MSAMTRRLGTSMVVGLLVLAGAAACGDSETPPSTRTTTASPSTTTSPSPTPEPLLDGPTVVAVRQLSDGSRVLVAHDLVDGTTRQLTTLQREDHPTLDAAGTSVVVEQYTGTAAPRPWVTSGTASHLVQINLDTGGHGQLTETTEGVFDHAPIWNRPFDGWVYFIRSGPAVETAALWRVDPATGNVGQVPLNAVQEAPNGAGISQFVLEPHGRAAWVQADWCDDTGACGGAHRLDLVNGTVSRHAFDPAVGGNLAWTPDGAWLAYSSNLGGAPGWPELTITPWPGGEPRTLLKMPEGAALFGQVGWQPDGSVVVLQTRSSSSSEGSETTQPEQRILLVDTTDGSSTPIGPSSVSDLSFDVWAPPAVS